MCQGSIILNLIIKYRNILNWRIFSKTIMILMETLVTKFNVSLAWAPELFRYAHFYAIHPYLNTLNRSEVCYSLTYSKQKSCLFTAFAGCVLRHLTCEPNLYQGPFRLLLGNMTLSQYVPSICINLTCFSELWGSNLSK